VSNDAQTPSATVALVGALGSAEDNLRWLGTCAQQPSVEAGEALHELREEAAWLA
jgi:hypothetical protein